MSERINQIRKERMIKQYAEAQAKEVEAECIVMKEVEIS